MKVLLLIAVLSLIASAFFLGIWYAQNFDWAATFIPVVMLKIKIRFPLFAAIFFLVLSMAATNIYEFIKPREVL